MLRSPIEQAYPRADASAPQLVSAATLANRARWFALTGAAVWLYVAWAPWVVPCPISPEFPQCSSMFSEAVNAYPHALLDAIALRPFAPSGLGWALNPVLWGALTPLGLLIAICLWSRRFGEAARIVYALWLVVMGSMAAIALGAWMSVPPPGPDDRLHTGAGIYMLFIVVMLLVGAAISMGLQFTRRAERQMAARARAEPVREKVTNGAPVRALRLASALMLTLGIVCWGYSWLFLRWTPIQDPNNCLTIPQDCLGISAARAMVLGGYPYVPYVDPLIFQYAFPVLLVGGAANALYVAWWPRHSARHWLGIALWLGLVTWAYSVANRGAAEIPYGFGFAGFNSARFLPETLASLGIAVGFASLIPLFAVMYPRTKHRGNTRAPDQRAVV